MDEPKTDLVAAWQDATLASDLAERLAKSALEAVDEADRDAAEADRVARLAEHAAHSAEEAAVASRAAAERSRWRAATMRSGRLADAETALDGAQATESEARKRIDQEPA